MSNKMPNDSPAETASAPKNLLFIGGILGLAIVGWLFLRPESSLLRTDCTTNPDLEVLEVSAGDRTVRTELAKTGEEKAKGLSYRNCLNPDSGMLFSYELPGDYCYWMKDMNFSIDMIWLDEEKRVVTIKDSVSPSTYPQSFCPDKQASYVLEVADGYAKRAGWQTGTQFTW